VKKIRQFFVTEKNIIFVDKASRFADNKDKPQAAPFSARGARLKG
jgi:hypothetical protein